MTIPRARSSACRSERRPSYAEAHIHVKSGDGAHGDVVEAIVAGAESHSPRLRHLGLIWAPPGQRAVGREDGSSPGVKVAGRGLPLEPLAVAHAIFALDPVDLASSMPTAP